MLRVSLRLASGHCRLRFYAVDDRHLLEALLAFGVVEIWNIP
jgi:hypothetical protein